MDLAATSYPKTIKKFQTAKTKFLFCRQVQFAFKPNIFIPVYLSSYKQQTDELSRSKWNNRMNKSSPEIH